jgi:SAM-dependent methyltransferase
VTPVSCASAGARRPAAFPDWRYSPNIGGHPHVYELENRAMDEAGHVLDAMRGLADWHGSAVVDLGCGTGYWLPRYARTAARVIGVEPDPGLRAAAAQRVRAEPAVHVLPGSAEHPGLPARSADLVHARFAYFFPPGCGAGLTEVLRLLRPGGTLVAVDYDYRWGEFASLLAAGSAVPPRHAAARAERWWRERGAAERRVRSHLRFASRADLEAVLRIEVPGQVAADWLERNPAATGLTCGYTLFAISV